MSDGAESEPLPEIDRSAVDQFARAYFESVGEDASARQPEAECFGDSVEMADELLDLVLAGTKRATAGAVADYEAESAPIPQPGLLWIACDGRGQPRVMLRTTEVRVGPLDSVDARFARDEGEGDRSLNYWLQAHSAYFERRFAELGLAFHPQIPVVFERFEVAFPV